MALCFISDKFYLSKWRVVQKPTTPLFSLFLAYYATIILSSRLLIQQHCYLLLFVWLRYPTQIFSETVEEGPPTHQQGQQKTEVPKDNSRGIWRSTLSLFPTLSASFNQCTDTINAYVAGVALQILLLFGLIGFMCHLRILIMFFWTFVVRQKIGYWQYWEEIKWKKPKMDEWH